MKRILIVSNTPFFGSGEQFIVSILSSLENAYFIVLNPYLYSKLPNSKKVLFSSKHQRIQLKQIKGMIKKWDIDIVLLNGGRSIFFTPFLGDVKKIIYRHTTNAYVKPI